MAAYLSIGSKQTTPREHSLQRVITRALNGSELYVLGGGPTLKFCTRSTKASESSAFLKARIAT
jgi:hypothetical protein